MFELNAGKDLSAPERRTTAGAGAADFLPRDLKPAAGLPKRCWSSRGAMVSTTRTYDSRALYRLSQLVTRGKNGSKIQNYAYTYDAVGNITQIANSGTSLAYATTSFGYDALNRLITASTTAASSTPYRQSYGYDLLGSLLAWASGSSASSTYSYSNSGYANPHAVTQIADGHSTTTYAYDNNGNLTSSGNGTATTTYTYDYLNRLTGLNAGGATTTYGYDYAGNRVTQTGTSTTWIYQVVQCCVVGS
jgi:YD repeat-containing protein